MSRYEFAMLWLKIAHESELALRYARRFKLLSESDRESEGVLEALCYYVDRDAEVPR